MTLRAFLIGLVGSLAMAITSPAHADISALYQVESWNENAGPDFDFGMTVEVNDAGDARIHVTGRTTYLLVKQGEVFQIARGIDGTYAERLSDLDAALKARGEIGGISFELFEQFEDDDVVETGETTIGSWKGTGFAVRDYDYEADRSPDLVMSDDEELALLAPVFQAAFTGKYGIAKTISLAGVPLAIYLMRPNVAAVFENGAPIKLGMLELSTISKDPIDPARFALPVRVLSREEIEDYLEPFEWAPAFARQPKG